ncbi:MAG: hypothetical protein ABIP06_06520 [Pyrinomonadaceae bacterium]
MIEIKLTFLTLEAAITAMAAVRAATPTGDAPGKSEPKAETPKPTKPEKAKPVETTPTAATPPAAASETKATESPSPTTSSISVTELGAAIKIAAATHREAVVATLAEFGAKAGKDLKPEQYTPFLAALEKATTPVDDLS